MTMTGEENSLAPSNDRPLPDGKLFHVFVSYRDSDEDREWVRELIANLQNRYRFICCDHATDFQPGMKIIDNIKFAITNSMKTLIILSKEYKESYWCEFEIEYALHLNMDLKEQILIPVLKEDCEIPDYLRPFTYIDAREKNVDLWLRKLVSAIESKGQNFNHQSLVNRATLETGLGNLEILHEEASRCNCGGPVFNTRYVPSTLNCMGSSLFSEIMQQIASTSAVRGRHCRNIWLPTLVSFTVLGAVISGLGIATVVPDPYEVYWENSVHITAVVFIIISAFMVLVWMPVCIVTNVQGYRQLNRICLESNRKLMTNNLMVAYSYARLKAEVKVLFFYYNSQACLDYIHNALKVHNPNDLNTLDGISELEIVTADNLEVEPLIRDGSDAIVSTDILKEEATNVLLKLSVPYLRDCIASKLDTAVDTRHTTRAMCICQYAEVKGIIKQPSPV